jgi:hypothetical protein
MMKYMGALTALGLIATTAAHAADVPNRTITKSSAPAMGDLFYGSLSAGSVGLGSYSNNTGVFAPLGEINGKLTYLQAGRGLGFQFDVNLAGVTSELIRPKLGSSGTAFIGGVTGHAFTFLNPTTKVGAYASYDAVYASFKNGGNINVPAAAIGAEGQTLLSQDLMLRGKLGYARILDTKIDGFSAKGVDLYTAGLGLTYAVSKQTSIGADVHYVGSASGKNTGFGNAGLLDVSAFSEYKFASTSWTARSEVGWMKPTNLSGAGSVDAYRVKISLKYDFGADQPGRRHLIDNEFKSYAVGIGYR